MKFISKPSRILLLFFLFLKFSMVYGQNDMRFSYACEEGFDNPIYSLIKLKFPKDTLYQLFADTTIKYEYSQKNFFKEQGKYFLMIYFYSDVYGEDSINYSFEINGKETNVNISISFDCRSKSYEEGENRIEKVPQGYIEVQKYYEAPNSIEISLNNIIKSDEYFKGPYFNLKNNSNDTIYGVSNPGYFWGRLFFVQNDSTFLERKSKWDGNFGKSYPLFPNSTKIATVGSFGLSNHLPSSKYRYELLFSKKEESTGISLFLDKPFFVWWAGTKEYYKLLYDFEIK